MACTGLVASANLTDEQCTAVQQALGVAGLDELTELSSQDVDNVGELAALLKAHTKKLLKALNDIQGMKMTFGSTGESIMLTSKTCTTLKFTLNSIEYTAEIESDEQLHFSDGDCWTKPAEDTLVSQLVDIDSDAQQAALALCKSSKQQEEEDAKITQSLLEKEEHDAARQLNQQQESDAKYALPVEPAASSSATPADLQEQSMLRGMLEKDATSLDAQNLKDILSGKKVGTDTDSSKIYLDPDVLKSMQDVQAAEEELVREDEAFAKRFAEKLSSAVLPEVESLQTTDAKYALDMQQEEDQREMQQRREADEANERIAQEMQKLEDEFDEFAASLSTPQQNRVPKKKAKRAARRARRT